MTAGEAVSFPARAGQTYVFTKYVGVVTSRDSSSPAADAGDASQEIVVFLWIKRGRSVDLELEIPARKAEFVHGHRM